MALDIYQEAFSLCMLADNITTVKGAKGQDNQDRLQKWVNRTHLISLAASGVSKQWTTVFGPAVWTHPDGTDADNTWFVSHNPAAQFDDGVHNTYILAIAGTVTSYDWEDEDFAIAGVVDFAGWMQAGINSPYKEHYWFGVDDSKNAYISGGTAQGMSVILGTPAPSGTPGAGKTILDYIAALPPTARLIITGHSLGSALAAGIACALKKCGKLDKLEKTLVYPSAGPSPGNALFAQYFAQSFPATPKPTSGPAYKIWNANIWNTLDIIPHAWSTTDPQQKLDNIEGIWPMGTALGLVVDGLVKTAKGLSDVSAISYTPLQGSSFKGGPPPVPTAENKDDLAKNARAEHIAEYIAFFGLPHPRPNTEASAQLGTFGLRVKTDKEVVEDRPFLELLRRVDNDPDKAVQDLRALHAAQKPKVLRAAKARGEARTKG